MSLKFRASPWVTYHPTVTPSTRSQPSSSTRMDDDVDMDAPQISTLREEETPPPQPKSTPRRNKASKSSHPTWTRPPRKEALTEEELMEDQEDEEDQLIDDDEEEVQKPAPAPSKAVPAVEAGTKRKAPTKQRKPRKTDKRITDEEKKLGGKAVQLPGAPNLAPTLTWFEATPSEVQSEAGGVESGGGGNLAFVDAGESLAGPGKPRAGETASGKKKANPRISFVASGGKAGGKASGTQTPEEVPSESEPTSVPSTPSKAASAKGGKKKAAAKSAASTKGSSKAKSKLSALPLLPDDGLAASEGLRTPTVASSPVTATMDLPEPGTPQVEPTPANSVVPPIPDDIQLEGLAQPQYPLPTKPFPVQPPPKIPTGLAPIIPLDKTGAFVRRWRPAQREIRGIAGGRWFARAWAGEKESEFAEALAATAAQNKALEENRLPGVTLPKLPAISISAPLAGRTGRPKGTKATNSSTAVSAAPSRDGSVGADGPTPGFSQQPGANSVSNAPRAPTKMRITVQPEPSDPLDVDMALVP